MVRSRKYTVAAVLTALLSLANVVTGLIVMAQGSDKVNSSDNQPPWAVLVIEVLIGVAGVIAAYGVWRRQRWGVVLTSTWTHRRGRSSVAAP